MTTLQTNVVVSLFKNNLTLFDQQMLFCSLALGRKVSSWDDLSNSDLRVCIGALDAVGGSDE